MSRIQRCRLWLPIVLAVVSCGVPRTHYYTIEVPRVSKGSGASIDRRIVVQRFSADQFCFTGNCPKLSESAQDKRLAAIGMN